MLAQNDAWMPRLAALFRSGAMKQLLTEGMSSLDSFTMSGDEVPRWKGKCYKVLSLPYNAKLHMVKPWIVDVIPDAEAADGHVNGNWLDQVLKFLFHVDEKTPLPKHSDIRSLDVLKKFAEARVNDIGNRLSNKRLIYGEQEELKFYQLGADKRTLTCCFLAGEDNVASLPELRGNAEWRLTNAFDAGCVAVCIQDEAIAFSCASFFSKARDLSTGKWGYEIKEEPEDVPEQGAGSSLSPGRRVLQLALSGGGN